MRDAFPAPKLFLQLRRFFAGDFVGFGADTTVGPKHVDAGADGTTHRDLSA
ncbi:hypothetical protein GCM10009585_02180 [Brevibacterium paucivorans]